MQIFQVIDFALQILAWLIIIDVILSYFPSVPRYHPLVQLLHSITEPVVGIFRKIIPPQRFGGAYVDFSPVLAILSIWIVRMILPG